MRDLKSKESFESKSMQRNVGQWMHCERLLV